MRGTKGQERRSVESNPTERLSHTLLSMWQRYPSAKVVREQDAFGVLLEDQSYLFIAFGGGLTVADITNFVALFARWLVAEPGYLMVEDIPPHGRSFAETVERYLPDGPPAEKSAS